MRVLCDDCVGTFLMISGPRWYLIFGEAIWYSASLNPQISPLVNPYLLQLHRSTEILVLNWNGGLFSFMSNLPFAHVRKEGFTIHEVVTSPGDDVVPCIEHEDSCGVLRLS